MWKSPRKHHPSDEGRDAAERNAVYWGIGKAADDGMIDGFQTVDENTSFYINADGNP